MLPRSGGIPGTIDEATFISYTLSGAAPGSLNCQAERRMCVFVVCCLISLAFPDILPKKHPQITLATTKLLQEPKTHIFWE